MAAVEMVNIRLNADPGFDQQHCTSLPTDLDHKTDIEGLPQSRTIPWMQSTLVAWQRRHCWIISEVFTVSIDSAVISVLPNGWGFFPKNTQYKLYPEHTILV